MQTQTTNEINEDLQRLEVLQKQASDLLSKVLRQMKKEEVKTSFSYSNNHIGEKFAQDKLNVVLHNQKMKGGIK